MNNFIETKEWFRLSFNDFDTAIKLYEIEDYDASVYHIQQCLEKCCKAVGCFLGVEIKKTHYPGKEIIKESLTNLYDRITKLR
ncbi:MAG: HEPN domain-containing protein [Elusimicrobiota bacterium]